jgi:hypothetical protein
MVGLGNRARSMGSVNVLYATDARTSWTRRSSSHNLLGHMVVALQSCIRLTMYLSIFRDAVENNHEDGF